MMKKFTTCILLAMLAIGSTQCKKSSTTENNNNTTAANDEMIIDGKKYTWVSTILATGCAQASISGQMRLIHGRTVVNGSGTSANQPDLSFVFSNVPPNGTTHTYTLDAGMWYVNGTAVTDKVMINGTNYHHTDGSVAGLYSADGSGTITVSADASGNFTYNFTNIKLYKSSGNLNSPVMASATNLVCH